MINTVFATFRLLKNRAPDDDADSPKFNMNFRQSAKCQSVGGASRDRTDDPLLAKQVLSQLSYGPEFPATEFGGSGKS